MTTYLSYFNPLSYFGYDTPSLGGCAPPPFEQKPESLKTHNQAFFPTFTEEFLQSSRKGLRKVPPPAPYFRIECNPYCCRRASTDQIPRSPVLSELLRKTKRIV